MSAINGMKWFSLLVCGVGLWVSAAVAAPPGPPPPPPPPPGGGPINLLEDVKNTKHNLSSTPSTASRNVFTSATSEICVFCHTPHGAAPETLSFGAPLWNRHLSTASYTLYDNTWSFSFEGELNSGAPTGFSRLCLSCHDGTIAIGSVLNAPGSGGYRQQIPITNGADPDGTMPLGSTELTGDTRRLGKNLRNDHPISFRFDSALVSTKDPELTNPGPPPLRPSQEPLWPNGCGPGCGIGPLRRYAGNNPTVYDSVQCVSCHNPHSVTYPKFLRAPIVDCSKPANPCMDSGLSANSVGQQLICFFCHNKDSNTLVQGNSYSTSTHAISKATHSTYPSAADHPSNPGYDFNGTINIGQASCRNCHDPHTAQGAIRLHREGVDTPGGGDAIENTCYLCHSPSDTAPSVIQPTPYGKPQLPAGSNTGFVADGTRIAPDIYTQFAKDHNLMLPGSSPCDQTPAGAPAKPLASSQTDCGSAMRLQLDDGLGALRAHQPFFIKLPKEGVEFNDPPPVTIPGNEDPAPPPTSYAMSQPDDLVHRHIECVDCHNPHQVKRPTVVGDAGRMKGMKGITYNDKVVGIEAEETGCLPIPCKREPYVYEVCFRCHGNAVPTLFQGDDNPGNTVFRSNPQPGALASAPDLSYQGFSNKRLEFARYGIAATEVSTDTSLPTASYEGNAPYAGMQRPTWTGGGVTTRYLGPGKHKSFHPVVGPGRNQSVQLFNQLKEAFGLSVPADLASLTIQCTDCHNNNYYDRFTNPGAFGASPSVPGGLLSGPLTESSLRTSDKSPSFLIDYNNPLNGRVAQPIGPHGSSYIRLLRARYNTDIANTNRSFLNDGFNADHFNNFLLCFQCHDRKAFDPNWAGADATNTTVTNFFGNPLGGPYPLPGGAFGGDIVDLRDTTVAQPGVTPWDLNLHMYHLVRTGAYCHECHYNVHSNAQARNTIFGAGTDCVLVDEALALTGQCAGNAGLPNDGEDGILDGISDTHLLNFSVGGPTAHTGHREVSDGGPGSVTCLIEGTDAGGAQGADNRVNSTFSAPGAGGGNCVDVYSGVEGVTAPNPVWYYDGSGRIGGGPNFAFRCNLRCHGVVMATCFYKPTAGEDVSPGGFWCAGGNRQRGSGNSGAL